jgi:hypothetical protein
MGGISMSKNCIQLLAALAMLLSQGKQLHAAIVFSNDFESDTSGFTAGGSLTSLTRVSLPTDSGGLASANQSMWLGRLGSGVAKSGSADEIVTLNLAGLTLGQQYTVAFDLLLGSSWDGSASPPYGPDSWRFAVNGTRLVNTTFTNGNQGQEYGAFSPQRYSDATYTSLIGPDFGKFTGADASFTTGGTNYAQHYGLYRFGRGIGNPVLVFTATGAGAVLEFARFGNTTDSADEYWALDNVQVANIVVPEPSSIGICSLLVWATAGAHRWRQRKVTA